MAKYNQQQLNYTSKSVRQSDAHFLTPRVQTTGYSSATCSHHVKGQVFQHSTRICPNRKPFQVSPVGIFGLTRRTNASINSEANMRREPAQQISAYGHMTRFSMNGIQPSTQAPTELWNAYLLVLGRRWKAPASASTTAAGLMNEQLLVGQALP